MKRRDFISLIGVGASWPVLAHAQAQRLEQMRRIGVLTQGSIDSHPTPAFRAFLNGLHQAGWDDGTNIKVEWRFSEGSAERLPQLASELVEASVEVIVTAPTEPTLAAKRATSTIPIVFLQVADPVRSGIVTTLSRPDANVTGMSALATDIAGKRLALIKEALPNARVISAFWNRPSKGARLILDELLSAGKRLGIEIQDAGIDNSSEIEGALRSAASKSSSLVMVIDDPVLQGHTAMVTRIAQDLKLPLASQSADYARNGGLMAYGPDLDALYGRGADYVNRILRGAKPKDLPVQQPEKFNLVLNLKTAKALGIEFPALLLARADEVVE
jgi:putative tryptophan/tyrosine transport system substrate-binding protein